MGTVGAAPTAMKALTNCKAVGEMGQTGGFVDCTTLLDTAKQFISDLPEGAEKSIGFIDDPSNADFAALLNAADKRETVQFTSSCRTAALPPPSCRCPAGK